MRRTIYRRPALTRLIINAIKRASSTEIGSPPPDHTVVLEGASHHLPATTKHVPTATVAASVRLDDARDTCNSNRIGDPSSQSCWPVEMASAVTTTSHACLLHAHEDLRVDVGDHRHRHGHRIRTGQDEPHQTWGGWGGSRSESRGCYKLATTSHDGCGGGNIRVMTVNDRGRIVHHHCEFLGPEGLEIGSALTPART